MSLLLDAHNSLDNVLVLLFTSDLSADILELMSIRVKEVHFRYCKVEEP